MTADSCYSNRLCDSTITTIVKLNETTVAAPIGMHVKLIMSGLGLSMNPLISCYIHCALQVQVKPSSPFKLKASADSVSMRTICILQQDETTVLFDFSFPVPSSQGEKE